MTSQLNLEYLMFDLIFIQSKRPEILILQFVRPSPRYLLTIEPCAVSVGLVFHPAALVPLPSPIFLFPMKQAHMLF